MTISGFTHSRGISTDFTARICRAPNSMPPPAPRRALACAGCAPRTRPLRPPCGPACARRCAGAPRTVPARRSASLPCSEFMPIRSIAHLRVAQPAAAQPLLHHLDAQLRAGHGVDAGEAHLAGADVAVEIADDDLIGRRARLRPRAGTATRSLARPAANVTVGDVQHAVRRDVGGGIVHLVQQLLGAGRDVDAAAGAGGLATPRRRPSAATSANG